MKLKAKNSEFTNLFLNEKVISSLQPMTTIGNLNAILFGDIKNNTLNLFVKDPTAHINISIPTELEVTDFEEDYFGFHIDLSKFLYAIKQYSTDKLKTIMISLEQNKDKSNFIIQNGSDKMTLPAYFIDSKAITSAIYIVKNWDTTNNVKFDGTFVEMNYNPLRNGGIFVSKDENKNNALAIYPDKIIVNDKRHIFIDYVKKSENTETKYFALHKKNAKIILESYETDSDYSIQFTPDYQKFYLSKKGFAGVFMNSLSNIVPPTIEELESISPTTKVFETTGSVLLDACKFFQGFYTSSSEFKILSIEVDGEDNNELKFYLKDSGIAGFGACNIEKTVSGTKYKNSEAQSCMIIFDSLKDYLRVQNNPEDIFEIYMEPDMPALFIKNEQSEIYLAKVMG